jgi:hypothetical protein
MLAAAIRIQGKVERHIRRRGHLIDDSPRPVKKHLTFDTLQLPIGLLMLHPLAVQLLSQNMQTDRFKTIARIDPRPATMRQTLRQGIPIRKFSFFHAEQFANKQSGSARTTRAELLVEKTTTSRPDIHITIC